CLCQSAAWPRLRGLAGERKEGCRFADRNRGAPAGCLRVLPSDILVPAGCATSLQTRAGAKVTISVARHSPPVVETTQSMERNTCPMTPPSVGMGAILSPQGDWIRVNDATSEFSIAIAKPRVPQ